MGWVDWLRGKTRKRLESVAYDYNTQTASVRETPVTVDVQDAWTAAIKHGFKFVEFVIDGIRLASIDRKDNGQVYEVYNCESRREAIRFLESIPQNKIPELYYVVVETPEGNVGKDMNGIFDE